MSQNWLIPPAAGVVAGIHWKTNVSNALASLRSLFAGTSAPSSKEAFMFWADTANGLLKMRDNADATWITIGPLEEDLTYNVVLVNLGAVSATGNYFLGSPKEKSWKIHRVRILSDTTTSGSDGTDNWEFQIHNITAAADLLATAVDTDTDGEITLDVAYDIDADQNQTIAIDDVVRLEVVKNNSPTSPLANIVAQLEYSLGI